MRTTSVNNVTDNDFWQGIMSKQQPVFPRQWQKRYFVLDTKILKYYKNKSDYDQNKLPKGVLNFNQIWIEDEYIDKDKKINLQMKGSKRVFNLWVAKNDEYGVWKSKLTHSINTSLGTQKQIQMDQYSKDLEENVDFWRFLRISEEEL